MTTATEIVISKLRLDGGTQSRVALNAEHIRDMAEFLADPAAQLTPIEVVHDGKDFWPWDAYHRIEAHRVAGRKTIMANVRQGTRRDAVLLSCAANARHGLKRSADDLRRQIIVLLSDPEWGQLPDREIARRCDTANRAKVAQLRADLVASASGKTSQMRVVERAGKTFTMNVGGIGAKLLNHLPPERQLEIIRETEAAAQAEAESKGDSPPKPKRPVLAGEADDDLRVTLTLTRELADRIDASARRTRRNRERVIMDALAGCFDGPWKGKVRQAA